MKFACICSTKNEGDVIEAFVRLNGRFVDTFLFVDDSTDKTRAILKLLAGEGYDIRFLAPAHGGHNQPTSTKSYLSTAKRQINPDWIFLLDADEIIVATSKEAIEREIRELPPYSYLAAEWKTYVPCAAGYFDAASPLSDCFQLRKDHDRDDVHRKASVPGRIVDNLITTPGNHSARSLTRVPVVEHLATSYCLAHFPVRSSEQIVVKNLIAMHNLVARSDAEDGEGFHVFPVAEMIRNRDYVLTLEDLAHMAVNYARREETPRSAIQQELDHHDNAPLRTTLRYLDLGKINVVARLDAEIARLSHELKEKRRTKFDALYFQGHHLR